MRTSTILAVLASAYAVSAQSIPSCAASCLTSADTSGCSSASDYKCLCGQQTFINGMVDCSKEKCSAADLQSAVGLATKLCEGFGVSVTLPGLSSTAAPSGSGASSVSASTTASASSTAPAATGNGASAMGASAFLGALALVAGAAL